MTLKYRNFQPQITSQFILIHFRRSMSSEAIRLLLEAVQKLKPEKRKYERRPDAPPPNRSLNKHSLKLSRAIKTIERGNRAADGWEDLVNEIPAEYQSFLNTRIAVLRHVASQRNVQRDRSGVPANGEPTIHDPDRDRSQPGAGLPSVSPSVSHSASTKGSKADRHGNDKDIFAKGDTSAARGPMEVDDKPAQNRRSSAVRGHHPDSGKRRRDHTDDREASFTPTVGSRLEPTARNQPQHRAAVDGPESQPEPSPCSRVDYDDYF